uniref:NSE1 homolog, SMC5-SMC6 complex component n=1 Tax=Sinocyclocheilus anshuiensis TaxID=1608454 RepID=A0A671SIL5_9TELE
MSRTIGDSHKRFLQTIMSNGIISASQAIALHKHCCETHGDRLDDFINVINAQLQPFLMHIRKGMSEEDGLEDTPPQNENFVMNHLPPCRSKPLNERKKTELVLNKFVQDKWLKEKDGEYTLSVHCIVELEQYMRTIYQDLIKVCHVCHNIALQMHLPCVSRYFRARSNPRCPACNDFWPHEISEMQHSQSQSSQKMPSSSKENPAPTPSRRS